MREQQFENLIGKTTTEIQETVAAQGLPAYRGRQIADWLYRKTSSDAGGGFLADFLKMTDLPQIMRQTLAETFSLQPLLLDTQQHDARDGTVKALARLQNGGHPIECVLLPDEKSGRVSCCLSTQAGCPMACAFCATGTQGLTRNLTAGEIVAQYLLLQSLSKRRISHIVLMGMGEPLLNYDAVLQAVKILNAECGVAMRHITLSTVGIVPNIDKLAAENLQLTLAVSLHAPTDALRTRLVPVNKSYPIEALIAACRRYLAATHRRLTFEYVLLREVNDRPEDARTLAALLKSLPCAVNLIPYNPTSVAEPFQKPEPTRIAAFRKILEDGGVRVTQRKERGQQIAAACGQLVTETERRRPVRALPVLPAGAVEMADDAEILDSASENAPISSDDALIWLAAARSSALLTLVREREFAPLAARAFAGFPLNSKGFANPIVRRRLAAEAVKDSAFAEKLRALADQAPPPVAALPVERPAAPDLAAELIQERAERRRERETFRRERDEFRAAAAQQETARTDAESARQQAEAERDAAQAAVAQMTARLERLERKARRAEETPKKNNGRQRAASNKKAD